MNGEQEAGYHEVRFDGSGLSSGVYFYRMQVRGSDSASPRDSKSGAGSFVQTRKLVILSIIEVKVILLPAGGSA